MQQSAYISVSVQYPRLKDTLLYSEPPPPILDDIEAEEKLGASILNLLLFEQKANDKLKCDVLL